MSFICRAHQAKVAECELTAYQLWQGAMHNGYDKHQRCRLQDARAFFGAAFEIAKIRVLYLSGASEFNWVQYLNDAAEGLSETLVLLDDVHSAQQCLLERHYLLLNLSVDDQQPSWLTYLAKRLARGSLDRLVDLLRLNHRDRELSAIEKVTDTLLCGTEGALARQAV